MKVPFVWQYILGMVLREPLDRSMTGGRQWARRASVAFVIRHKCACTPHAPLVLNTYCVSSRGLCKLREWDICFESFDLKSHF